MTRHAVIVDCDLGSSQIESEELHGIADVAVSRCKSEADVIEAAASADAVLVQYAPISRKVVQSLPRCRVISRYGIGVDMIDVAAATEYGIPVCNVPAYCIEEVSDHTCALILMLVRKIPYLSREVKKGHWNVREARPIHHLNGRVLGLLGAGRIGRRVARKLSSFGVRTVAYDPYLSKEVLEKDGIAKDGLTSVLSQSDYLSLHLPLNDSTRHILGGDEFAAMKAGAIIVNTSRGPLIDETALVAALRNGRLGGAGLDVTETEPIEVNHELLSLENVIVTPHAAFYSETALEELKRQTARAVARILTGMPRLESDGYSIVNENGLGNQRDFSRETSL